MGMEVKLKWHIYYAIFNCFQTFLFFFLEIPLNYNFIAISCETTICDEPLWINFVAHYLSKHFVITKWFISLWINFIECHAKIIGLKLKWNENQREYSFIRLFCVVWYQILAFCCSLSPLQPQFVYTINFIRLMSHSNAISTKNKTMSNIPWQLLFNMYLCYTSKNCLCVFMVGFLNIKN